MLGIEGSDPGKSTAFDWPSGTAYQINSPIFPLQPPPPTASSRICFTNSPHPQHARMQTQPLPVILSCCRGAAAEKEADTGSHSRSPRSPSSSGGSLLERVPPRVPLQSSKSLVSPCGREGTNSARVRLCFAAATLSFSLFLSALRTNGKKSKESASEPGHLQRFYPVKRKIPSSGSPPLSLLTSSLALSSQLRCPKLSRLGGEEEEEEEEEKEEETEGRLSLTSPQRDSLLRISDQANLPVKCDLVSGYTLQLCVIPTATKQTVNFGAPPRLTLASASCVRPDCRASQLVSENCSADFWDGTLKLFPPRTCNHIQLIGHHTVEEESTR
ncbi:hypothetical protein D9C73_002549 [Collichthys lucidus]|uniref:Uncharacterized protein n=1 Tax=Collichthys lucidus TaxID=240159 RepID=A0A4U5U2Y6_COLLU|nr:hypothetical protein D9C73_002549 [Collichthys lucidus]